MKVLILTCLVALALARQKEELSVSTETLENLSSEESFTHINKQKLEKVKHEEQQQREDQGQDKIHPVIQQQPLVYPYAEAIPYTVLPQGILTVGQLPVLPPFLQPEILETPKAKETVLPKSKAMPFLKAPTVLPAFEPQIPSFTDLKNQHLLLPPLQPVVHQVPQPFPQTPMLPPQPQLLLPQPQLLLPPQPSLQLVPQVPQPIPQQAVPYLQRDLPVPALLLYQDLVNPTRQFYPATQQLPPVYNHVNV